MRQHLASGQDGNRSARGAACQHLPRGPQALGSSPHRMTATQLQTPAGYHLLGPTGPYTVLGRTCHKAKIYSFYSHFRLPSVAGSPCEQSGFLQGGGPGGTWNMLVSVTYNKLHERTAYFEPISFCPPKNNIQLRMNVNIVCYANKRIEYYLPDITWSGSAAGYR